MTKYLSNFNSFPQLSLRSSALIFKKTPVALQFVSRRAFTSKSQLCISACLRFSNSHSSYPLSSSAANGHPWPTLLVNWICVIITILWVIRYEISALYFSFPEDSRHSRNLLNLRSANVLTYLSILTISGLIQSLISICLLDQCNSLPHSS